MTVTTQRPPEVIDPAAYARALASSGPAYEAIQEAGEEAFVQFATDLARERVRDGLPLRAAIAVVGYLAKKPATAGVGYLAKKPATAGVGYLAKKPATAGVGYLAKKPAVATTAAADGADESPDIGFLALPEPSADAQRLYDVDIEAVGYVMNGSKLWSYQPIAVGGLFDLMGQAARAGSLTFRQRGILVAACASALGDAYCSLAWGTKLAGEAGEQVAGSVLRGDDDGLDPSERVLAQWARQITRDPNATDVTDIQSLRDAGYDDAQIFAITAFVALRIAFSTVNDALGARPDRELGEAAPASVRNAVTFGRSVGTGTGEGRTGAK